MIMYLVECTMPVSGEVRFFGKNQTYILAGEPHRIVAKFALDHGFPSHYAAEFEAAKLPGKQKTVIRAET